MIARQLSGFGWSNDSAFSNFSLVSGQKQDDKDKHRKADINNARFMTFLVQKYEKRKTLMQKNKNCYQPIFLTIYISAC